MRHGEHQAAVRGRIEPCVAERKLALGGLGCSPSHGTQASGHRAGHHQHVTGGKLGELIGEVAASLGSDRARIAIACIPTRSP